jgi:hypothetical protein
MKTVNKKHNEIINNVWNELNSLFAEDHMLSDEELFYNEEIEREYEKENMEYPDFYNWFC